MVVAWSVFPCPCTTAERPAVSAGFDRFHRFSRSRAKTVKTVETGYAPSRMRPAICTPTTFTMVAEGKIIA
jgi:hypothetical protein